MPFCQIVIVLYNETRTCGANTLNTLLFGLFHLENLESLNNKYKTPFRLRPAAPLSVFSSLVIGNGMQAERGMNDSIHIFIFAFFFLVKIALCDDSYMCS